MKKLWVILLVLLVSLFLIVSCGDDKGNDTDTNQTNNSQTENNDTPAPELSVATEKLEDVSSYTVVVADAATAEMKAKAEELIAAINEKTGVSLEFKTDYGARSGKKIVIGKSKHHNVDPKAMEKTDYIIKMEEDGDIAIIGGVEKATFAAVDFFIKNFIKADTKEVLYPTGAGYTKDCVVKSLKIDGVDISEFKIFALDNIDEGHTLADDILYGYLDIELPVESGAKKPGGDKYIIVDRQSYAYHDYSMKVEGGNLYITGSYRSLYKALEAFESYLDGSHGADVAMTSADNYSGKLPTVKPLYSTKDELLAIYEYAADSGYTLYGEHNIGGLPSEFEAKFREKVGDGPVSIDYDMINAYTGGTEGEITRTYISQVICEYLEFAARGGIVTTMCHWTNPNEKTRVVEVKQADGSFVLQDSTYRGSIGSKELWSDVLTKGTEFNKRWHEQLDFNAEIYQAFKDLGLPVTFRPMLEANTGNMWWCYHHEECMLTGDDLRDMWNYVYDYYVNDLGLDNILWVYSPNAYTGGDTYTDMFYPGDDKCDIVGIDWYIDSFHNRSLAYNYGYQDILEFGKPAGLCEWGVVGGLQANNPEEAGKKFSCKDFVDVVKLAKSAGLTVSFIETYSGWFGSATWLPGAEILNETAGIVLLDDMPDVIRNALG